MKIGIDVSRANNDKKTGVEWYVYFLIEELKKIEIKTEDSVEFILYSDKPLKGKLAKLPEWWNSKVLRWPPKRLWTQIRLSWEMLVNPPDILFIPAHVFPLIHPRKTVMTVHDIAAERFPKSYNWFERWYSLWSAKYAVKHLWRVIVPSRFTKKEITKSYQHTNTPTHQKIHVVHHGYDIRYRKIEDDTKIEEVLKKYGVEKPFIMTIGRLEEKKNTKRIIEAFNILRLKSYALSLVLVGKPGYGYEKVKEVIDSSPYKKDIITPGWVDEEDLPYLMNGAEVFVFPSLYEGFGMPILEAMACGTPVVASKGSSLEEVGSNATVFVDPLDSRDISEALNLLLSNEQLRTQRVERGLERIQSFSWKACARETRNIFLGIVDET